MRLRHTFFLALFPILIGCGGVQVVLKPPVEDRCTKTGLKGCPALTDGVLLYVQGEEAKGKDALIKGAAENTPAKVRKFAKALRQLKSVPGISSYMTKVLEVADILAGAAKPEKGRKPGPEDNDMDD
jgi:hypothetical protein